MGRRMMQFSASGCILEWGLHFYHIMTLQMLPAPIPEDQFSPVTNKGFSYCRL